MKNPPNCEEALFALALEKPTEKRSAFLDAVCDSALATAAPIDKKTMKLEIPDAPDEAVG